MWQFLLAALERKVAQQVTSKVLPKVLGKNTSSFLGLVKGHMKMPRQKVDYLFDKQLRLRSLKRALNRPGVREQGRRITKKGNIKRAFKTLSGDYLKKQLGFIKNQRQFTPAFSSGKLSAPVASARAAEQSILRRLMMTNKRRVTDRSPLNSSGLHYGVWQASTAQEDYGTGTLTYTVKHEYKDGSVRIGRTYTKHKFSLTSGSLMQVALGRDGTGAGTVYWQDKRGGIGSKEVVAGRWSEQEVKAEVTSPDTTKKEDAKPSKQQELKVDPVTKELEELRKFKAEVEAERKLEKEKPKEVVVSDTFFGKKDGTAKQATKSNTEKAGEELSAEGVPRRHDN